LSPASTHSRTSRSSEPWCNAIRPAHSGFASSTAWYQISDCERVLVKTSVVLLDAISSTTCGSIVRPRWPPQGKRSARPGSSESMISFFGTWPWTSVRIALATEQRVHRLMQVAERRRHAPDAQPGFQRRNRANASCTCTPRLLPSSSCHSSTTTISHGAEHLGRIGAREQQRQAFGRGDQHGGQAAVLRGTLAELVSPLRAPADQSGGAQRLQRLLQRAQRVGRQRAHGRDPETVSGGATFFALARTRRASATAVANAFSAPSHTA
jgi:hypothetical protein